jgi:DNA-binding NtrC family response regulator
MKVALIEDNPELCGAMEELLALHGHEARTFLCAMDLYTTLDPNEVDALIADYYLPDINGLEVVRNMREARPDLPVIMTTTTSRMSVIDAIRNLPNCRLLPKPIDFELLLGELARISMRVCGLRLVQAAG